MTLLTVSGISVRAGQRSLVKDVDLAIETGTWSCVVGPNGAGKSTLLRAVAGLVASTGHMTIDDRDLTTMHVRDRACWIAYVAQEPLMPAGMHVRDYVLLGRTAHLRLLSSESQRDLDITDMVIDELDLGALASRDVATLSGGERQRVAIARALAQASPIVLLDEPTTALDVGYQQDVLELIDRLRKAQKIGVLSTMHDLTVAGLYPDDVLLMAGGQIHGRGDAKSVLTAEAIAAAYGATVRVIDDPSGPIVVPQRNDPS